MNAMNFRRKQFRQYFVVALFVSVLLSMAAQLQAAGSPGSQTGDPIAPVILGVTGILFFAIVGRYLARRINQPTVVGELAIGIVIGNLGYYFGSDLIILLREGPQVFAIAHLTLAGTPLTESAATILGPELGERIARILSGPNGGEMMQVAQTVDIFSRYGVIFLLYMAGLETNLAEMRESGADSVRVAILGVAIPFLFGFAAARVAMPDAPLSSDLFIAATLGATSIGITARVLKEMGYSHSHEGHVILGAAVFDDILGLVLLAIVSGIAVHGTVELGAVTIIIFLSALFLLAAVYIGPAIVRLSARLMAEMDMVEAKMFTSFLFVMVLAWAANLIGLATIIGAFAAGVVFSDSIFLKYHKAGEKQVSARELIMPLEVILVPIFFILMGIQVKLETFFSLQVIAVATGLLVAAIAGKLLSGWGAKRGANRLMIGFGMLPRGEVGLVFAAIGKTLGVIDDAIFSAIVLMVVITTLIAPPLLKYSITREQQLKKTTT